MIHKGTSLTSELGSVTTPGRFNKIGDTFLEKNCIILVNPHGLPKIFLVLFFSITTLLSHRRQIATQKKSSSIPILPRVDRQIIDANVLSSAKQTGRQLIIQKGLDRQGHKMHLNHKPSRFTGIKSVIILQVIWNIMP